MITRRYIVNCPNCRDSMFKDDKIVSGTKAKIWYICPDCGMGAVSTLVKGVMVKTEYTNCKGEDVKTVKGVDNELVLQNN